MKRIFVSAIILFLAVCAYADEKRYVVPLEDSPAYGPPDAVVTMIEFLDYQ